MLDIPVQTCARKDSNMQSQSRCIGVITINTFHIIHEKPEVVFQERGRNTGDL